MSCFVLPEESESLPQLRPQGGHYQVFPNINPTWEVAVPGIPAQELNDLWREVYECGKKINIYIEIPEWRFLGVYQRVQHDCVERH